MGHVVLQDKSEMHVDVLRGNLNKTEQLESLGSEGE